MSLINNECVISFKKGKMDVEGEAQCFHPCMAGQAWCEVGVNIASSGFGELWKQTPPVRCQDAVEGG